MKALIALLLLGSIVTAQAQTIIVNQSIQSHPNGASNTFNIGTAAGSAAAQYELLIENGDGLNYFPLTCSGSFVQKILCKAQNLIRAAYVHLDRPTQLEVKLNSQVIVNRQNFPKEQGQYFLNLNLSEPKNLTVTTRGLPTSDITIRIKELSVANQNPISQFIFNSQSYMEPSLVSFSALTSSDPDGSIVSYIWNFGDGSNAAGALVDHIFENAGSYNVSLTVTDNRGAQHTQQQVINIQADNTAPVLSSILPANQSEISGNSIVLSGESNESLTRLSVQINSEPVYDLVLDEDNRFVFSSEINFTSGGTKNITLTAYDIKNNSSVTNLLYNLNFNTPPQPVLKLLAQNSSTAPSLILFDASDSSDADGDALTYNWNFDDGENSSEISPTHLFKNAGSFDVVLTVTDSKGVSRSATRTVQVDELVLPRDPAEIAPPLAEKVFQTNAEKYNFLYDHPEAAQRDVDLTKIDEERVMPIRGKILDTDNQPLSGVKVTVKDHPEFGYTLSREDGVWDLAANGGGDLTLEFDKVGFISAFRKVDTSKKSSRTLEDIIFTAIDSESTKISFNSNNTQIHETSLSSDSDGERKTQILIPAETTAEVVLPDGSRKAMNSLTIRATELTVGDNGFEKMPAPLPALTAYTYCANFTADEAQAYNADRIEFSKPVPVYVDNFLNIPVGMLIPVGYLNEKTGLWESNKDGLVVKVIGLDGNQQAILDVQGYNIAATTDQLTHLNINASELSSIAQKFQVGSSFWRVEIKHFSFYDFNPNNPRIPTGLPRYIAGNNSGGGGGHGGGNAGAGAGGGGGGGGGGPPPGGPPEDPPCNAATASVTGCFIQPASQTLGENIPLEGISFNLNYISSRSKSSLGANEISIDVFPTLALEGTPIQSAEVSIEIGSKKITQTFSSPQLNTMYSYSWDGLDEFGRQVNSSANATITTTYYVQNRYALQRYAGFDTSSFNNPSSAASSNIIVNGRSELAPIVNAFNVTLSSPFDMIRSSGFKQFNGWSIDPLHSYDPLSQILYKGTTETFKVARFFPSLSNIAGNGSTAVSGNNQAATLAGLNSPTDLTTDSAGNIFYTDAQASVIRKIDKNGVISHVAGNGDINDYTTNNNDLAVNAGIGEPVGIRITEIGEIFFTDRKNSVVRKIDAAGVISTIAGTGTAGYSNDNELATQAQLNKPEGLALAKDGSIYVCDTSNYRIRRISTTGIISTLSHVSQPPKFGTFDQNGNFYFTANIKIYKLTANGLTEEFAGSNGDGFYGPNVENMTARNYYMNPVGIAIDEKNNILFADIYKTAIRKITPERTIQTLVNESGLSGYNGSTIARNARLNEPSGLWLDSDKNLLIADKSNHRLRKYSAGLPNKFPASIASNDGNEIYYFNNLGQHTHTMRADTNAVKLSFIYDTDNNLIQIKDSYQKVTNLNRDANGNLKSIVGPYGQTHEIILDSNNYISQVKNPLNNSHQMTYSPTGLLLSFKKPEGNTATYEYNSSGFLTKATEPDGSAKTLVRNGSVVTLTNATGLVTKYDVNEDSSNNLFAVLTNPDTLASYNQTLTSFGAEQNLNPLGIRTRSYTEVDPRFGGQVGYISKFDVTNFAFSNSHIYESNTSRSYTTHADGLNFTRTENTSDNQGVTSITTYNSANRTTTTTSGMGRSIASVVDENEKPVFIQNGATLATEFAYDNLGRLKNITQGDRLTRFNYDSNGNLNEIIDPMNRSTQYISDTLGRITKTITPDSEETEFTFDKNSNLTGIKPPQKILHQFVSNAVDLISSYISPNSTGEQYSYDGDNRLQTITYESGFQSAYVYQNANNLSNSGKLTHIYSDFNFTFGRDTYNSVTTENKEIRTTNNSYIQIVTSKWSGDLLTSFGHNNNLNGASFGINYKYNQQLRLVAEETSYGNFGYSYDNDGLPTQFGALILNRDSSNGRITEKVLGNLKEIISYNAHGEVSERNYTQNNTSIYKETYTRDKLGRITNKTIFKNGNSNDHSYEYDQRGRLHKTYINTVLKNTYTYDANGNRLTKVSSNGDNYSAQYDSQDRITQFTLNNETTTFTRVNDDTQITQARPGESTVYQLSRHSPLLAVHKFLPTTSFTRSYDYDANLKRNHRYYRHPVMGNFVRLHTHYDDRGRLRATHDTADNIIVKTSYVYISQSHSPDYIVRNVEGGNETIYFIIKDQLGSILQLVDQNGNIAQDIEYDEFGNMLVNSNPEFQPLGFAGGLYDPDTKLTRFGARDYDPMIGRWLQRDPIKFESGTTNLYEYVNNDPVNNIDPTGLLQFPKKDVGVGPGTGGGSCSFTPRPPPIQPNPIIPPPIPPIDAKKPKTRNCGEYLTAGINACSHHKSQEDYDRCYKPYLDLYYDCIKDRGGN